MKEWRVIAVLLAVIVLLSVILGIKIINNTPEKQQENFKQRYSELQEAKKEDKDIESIDDISIELMNVSMKKIVTYAFSVVISIGIAWFVIILVLCKLYDKLGINEMLIKTYLVLGLGTYLSIFLYNVIITLVLFLIWGIVAIITLVFQYKAIEMNPYLLLLRFVPIVGIILFGIISIIATIKLADYFRKGIGFKLGLIFLPIIFYPILAFTAEE